MDDILEIAIKEYGGVSMLARHLDVGQNVVSNWRMRKRLPKPWRKVLVSELAKKPAPRSISEVK